MNDPYSPSDEQLDRLFAEARACPPDTDSVEYALETRVLALIRQRREQVSSWTLLSWKLLPFFACVVLMAGFWERQSMQVTEDAERLALDPSPHTLHLWEGFN